MCIVIGKWFPDTGWIAIKNRDRNYIPDISFKKAQNQGVEVLYFWDDITQYCEGVNSAGVGILSASLMTKDDEKEIQVRAKRASPDGQKIKQALQYPDVKAAAMSLIKSKLPGNTLIFDKDQMFLLEGCWKPGGYASRQYVYKIQEIPQDQTVVRTNHGVWLEWAGYQRGKTINQDQSRISSESRRLIALKVCKHANSAEDILDDLTKDYTHNGQLNALRTAKDNKKMRTTSQILVVPSKCTMFVRPVQSNINFNFWDYNDPQQKTWVEILSNRVLYKNLQDVDPDVQKPNFQNPGKVHH
jgi:hypothetical protein